MLVIAYLLIALVVFLVWLIKFLADTTTPKDDRISWIALMIGPLLWPIVLPFSILELVGKKRRVRRSKNWESPEIFQKVEYNCSLK